MNEADPIVTNPGAGPEPPHPSEAGAPTTRSGPDLLTLLVGLGALGIAGTALLGGLAWVPHVDGRWILAGLALIVGLLLILGSLRPSRR